MDITIYGFGVVGITLALTQIVKQFVASKWSPVISLVLGLGLVILGSWGKINAEIIFQGIAAGLMASGLYSGTKSIIGK